MGKRKREDGASHQWTTFHLSDDHCWLPIMLLDLIETRSPTSGLSNCPRMFNNPWRNQVGDTTTNQRTMIIVSLHRPLNSLLFQRVFFLSEKKKNLNYLKWERWVGVGVGWNGQNSLQLSDHYLPLHPILWRRVGCWKLKL